MACSEETKKINDVDYYCRQWPATKALTMKFRLAKTLGPALAEVVKLASAEEADAGTAISKAIGELFNTTNPEDLTNLIIDVVSSATRDGKRVTKETFDAAFTNNLAEVYQAFGFVLGLNYGSFFAGKLDLQAGAAKALSKFSNG